MKRKSLIPQPPRNKRTLAGALNALLGEKVFDNTPFACEALKMSQAQVDGAYRRGFTIEEWVRIHGALLNVYLRVAIGEVDATEIPGAAVH